MRSVAHDDWSNPSTWSNGLVPAAPDTIFIDHYVTLTASVTINAPTVLYIEQSGTLCGDYDMNVACGAKWINYGSVYLGQLEVRDGWNYCTLTCKNGATVSGGWPSGSGSGFYNMPPKGNINIGAFPSCRTQGTQWENGGATGGGCTVGIVEYSNAEKFRVYPNPVSDRLYVDLDGKKADRLMLVDLTGRRIKMETGSAIDLSALDTGMYVLTIITGDKSFEKRIIKN